MGHPSEPAYLVLLPWLTRVSGLCALCLWVGGCDASDNDCTDDAYADTIQVQFVPALTQPGNYRLTLTAGSVNGSCNVVVGGSVLEPCTSAHLSVTGKGSDGLVVLSTVRAWFDYAPLTFDLTITRNDVDLLTKTIMPEFVVDEPNGKGCGLRRQAVVPLAVNP